MARPKSFDVDTVLEQAVQVFWNHGYEATSISDLERELGVGRQSLYNTFGGKHELFVAALERYAAMSEDYRFGIDREDAGLAEIRDWFEATVRRAAPEGPRSACLIVNTMAELGAGDEAARDVCQKNIESITDQFVRTLNNAAERGEIRRPEDVEAAADCLVAQTYGILLLGKNGASLERLQALAKQALRTIS
jgi:TetR/AcrR family transcriptional repressor of nem operon